MLLKRLVDYATEQCAGEPAFHRRREFVWQLEIQTDGIGPRLRSLQSPNERGKRVGTQLMVPAVTRTRGAAANLAADDVQYVLGWGDATTKPERVADCHEAFVGLLQRWADYVDDENSDVAVAAEFFTRGGVSQLEPPEETIGAKDGVVVSVDGRRLIEHGTVVPFWSEQVASRKKLGASGICLVCGHYGLLVDTIPGKVAKSLVPGAENDAALVSVNAKAFGYRLQTGLSHTPICFTCGNNVNVGLTSLLSGSRVVRLAKQDTAMTWWTVGQAEQDLLSAMPSEADPKAVRDVLDRFARGELARAARQADDLSSDRFCSVSLGGSSSRIMVRDWIDMPLAHYGLNIGRWWDDVSIEHRGTIRGFKLWTLILATGRWDPDSGKRGSCADLGVKNAQRPEHIERDMVRASYQGTNLPTAVLRHVLHRIATDTHIDAPRAALVRLGLRRHPTKEIPMSAGLDETHTDSAYVSGRIFAHMERIQYLANADNTRSKKTENGEEEAETVQLNSGFGDRFLSGAISKPKAALLAGDKLVPAWLRRIRRRAPGLATALTEELAQLRARLDPHAPLPASLLLDQQGQFVLGYYHQKELQFAKRQQRRAE